MRRDPNDADDLSETTYEEDALGVPDHTTANPVREPIPVDEQMPPGEHARGSDAWGTTAAEQRAGKPLTDRLDEETADRGTPPADDDGVRLVDDGTPDETAELTSTGEPDGQDPSTAEESAVHVRQDAPGASTAPDSYVDDDRGASA
ncbi:MAG TPA: hypothetical protein VLA82_06220 [Actinomycetota bacterium]|nr:hypothetical protein [Actinomycetota bacterium]